MPPWLAISAVRVERVLLADVTAVVVLARFINHNRGGLRTSVVRGAVVILNFLQEYQCRTFHVCGDVLRNRGQGIRV